jgi:iron(III) transport system permease protein
VPAIAFSVALVGISLVIPAAVLLYLLVSGLREGIALNLTWDAALGSAAVSSTAALATLAAAVPIAVLAARYPSAFARRAEQGAYLGYSLPGLVVALAFVSAAAGMPLLYQSIPLLLIAYVVLFLPQAVEPVKDGLLRADPRIIEAGRTLGRSRAFLVRRVTIPLLSRPLASAAALVCLTVMKELPATLLLRPTGFETLATRVWTSASAGLYSRAAVPALMLILVAALPLWLLSVNLGRRAGSG